jgi:hypothetical protein
MKRILRTIIFFFIFFSSGLTIFLNYHEDFDPVEMAVEFKNADNRDQALDIIEFSMDNNIGDQEALKSLYGKYQYSFKEKSRDLFWHGAVKGDVFNMYSGIGCIAADLAIIGDVRDLSKQGINWFAGKDVDYIVAGLSAIGVGTTVASMTGPGGVVDAGVSVAKTTAKYVNKFFETVPDSIMKAALAGKKFTTSVYKKFWLLFKETKFSVPDVALMSSKIKNVKNLDIAIDLTKNLKKGGAIFLVTAGEPGLEVYKNYRKLGLEKLFVSAFKTNPKAILGLTRFNTIIHSVKIFQKQGFLLSTIILSSSLALILAVLPFWVPFVTLAASGGYLYWEISRRQGHMSLTTCDSCFADTAILVRHCDRDHPTGRETY